MGVERGIDKILGRVYKGTNLFMEFINLFEKLLAIVAVSVWLFAIAISGSFDPSKPVK